MSVIAEIILSVKTNGDTDNIAITKMSKGHIAYIQYKQDNTDKIHFHRNVITAHNEIHETLLAKQTG